MVMDLFDGFLARLFFPLEEMIFCDIVYGGGQTRTDPLKEINSFSKKIIEYISLEDRKLRLQRIPTPCKIKGNIWMQK